MASRHRYDSSSSPSHQWIFTKLHKKHLYPLILCIIVNPHKTDNLRVFLTNYWIFGLSRPRLGNEVSESLMLCLLTDLLFALRLFQNGNRVFLGRSSSFFGFESFLSGKAYASLYTAEKNSHCKKWLIEQEPSVFVNIKMLVVHFNYTTYTISQMCNVIITLNLPKSKWKFGGAFLSAEL